MPATDSNNMDDRSQPAPVSRATPPTYDDVARYISEETGFSEGFVAASLLVNTTASDIRSGQTMLGEFGQVETSEGRAFNNLVRHLHGDVTAVYVVLAMLAASDEKVARALSVRLSA